MSNTSQNIKAIIQLNPKLFLFLDQQFQNYLSNIQNILRCTNFHILYIQIKGIFYKIQQLQNLIKMRPKTQRNSLMQQLPSNMRSSQKKIKGIKRNNYLGKTQQTIQQSSVVPGHEKNIYTIQSQFLNSRPQDAQNLGMQYFTQKYVLHHEQQQNVAQEMKMLLHRKKNQIESLKIYRDELKFISRNSNTEGVKITVQTLKQKAEMQQKLLQQKAAIQKQLRKIDREVDSLSQYQKFMQNFMQTSINNPNLNYLDLTKQQEVMLKNLQAQKDMLIRQLAEEQKRNSRQIRKIQDQILEYRIMIKDKQDNLRNLKAKICTLYIKLHSRNNSRMGSKSKDRNMSLSIRKFNNNNHASIKQAYIGNKTFKSYAKQIIERVNTDQQLIKIKFYCGAKAVQGSKNKQQLFFQCFYKGRDGQLHDDKNLQATNDDDATRDKMSTESTQKPQQIYVKYLSSMKFYYKSKIVGVQCRVKTQRGNKHIYIGNCEAHVEHELLTLVNKRLVTMGSFWHGKQMIGVSVWYSDRHKLANDVKKPTQQTLKKQAYQQYYT